MSYYRTLDRETFAKFRASMRKGGNVVTLFGAAEARYDDPLYAKDALSARIAAMSIQGRLLVCHETHYGPDYDGTATRWYCEIPATLVHYIAWQERMQEQSEGVDYYNIVSWFSLEIPTRWARRGHDLWDAELQASMTEAFTKSAAL